MLVAGDRAEHRLHRYAAFPGALDLGPFVPCHFFTSPSLKALFSRAGLIVENNCKTSSPLWYPESFLRYAGLGGEISELYRRLSTATLLPFAPLVGLVALFGNCDKITMIVWK